MRLIEATAAHVEFSTAEPLANRLSFPLTAMSIRPSMSFMRSPASSALSCHLGSPTCYGFKDSKAITVLFCKKHQPLNYRGLQSHGNRRPH